MFCISWPALVCIYSNTDTAQKWEPFQTWLNTNELIDPAPHVGLPTRNRTYLEWPGLLRPASFSSTNRKALFWTIFNCLLRLNSPIEDSWSNDASWQSKEWFSLSSLDFLKLLSWLSGSTFMCLSPQKKLKTSSVLELSSSCPSMFTSIRLMMNVAVER